MIPKSRTNFDEALVDCFWPEGVADALQTGENNALKNLVHIIQNCIKLKTFTDKMVLRL